MPVIRIRRRPSGEQSAERRWCGTPQPWPASRSWPPRLARYLFFAIEGVTLWNVETLNAAVDAGAYPPHANGDDARSITFIIRLLFGIIDILEL